MPILEQTVPDALEEDLHDLAVLVEVDSVLLYDLAPLFSEYAVSHFESECVPALLYAITPPSTYRPGRT